MKYEVCITLRHWVDVEADDEDKAFQLAYDSLPTFTSDLEDCEADLETLD